MAEPRLTPVGIAFHYKAALWQNNVRYFRGFKRVMLCDAHALRQAAPPVSTIRADQAVALRRRRLCDPMASLDQWPANSLACLYGIAADAAAQQVLGSDVQIDVSALDECNTRVQVKRIIEQFRRHDGFGCVGLVGVQSNQYPRALDIARPLRAAGISVVIGGFHVSGCLAMLPGIGPDLQEALDLGITLFAGEAEGRMDGLLLGCGRRSAQNYLQLYGRPAVTRKCAEFLYLPRHVVARTLSQHSSFDAGRGSPVPVLVAGSVPSSTYRVANRVDGPRTTWNG